MTKEYKLDLLFVFFASVVTIELLVLQSQHGTTWAQTFISIFN